MTCGSSAGVFSARALAPLSRTRNLEGQQRPAAPTWPRMPCPPTPLPHSFPTTLALGVTQRMPPQPLAPAPPWPLPAAPSPPPLLLPLPSAPACPACCHPHSCLPSPSSTAALPRPPLPAPLWRRPLPQLQGQQGVALRLALRAACWRVGRQQGAHQPGGCRLMQLRVRQDRLQAASPTPLRVRWAAWRQGQGRGCAQAALGWPGTAWGWLALPSPAEQRLALVRAVAWYSWTTCPCP
ncbi:hypothetical protein V8C86DRAFT_2495161 [Haematococcus lacustris]